MAAALAGAGVRAIYSSPLRRAGQTAAAIGDRLGLGVTTDTRLVERMNWTGGARSLAEFRADWHRATTDRNLRPGHGESSRAAGERLEAALAELGQRHQGGTVVVVSHGGVTVDLARNLIGDEGVERLVPGITEEGVEPCAVTELSVHPGRIEVLGLGQVGWRPVGWLSAPAEDEVRSAVQQVAPHLGLRPIRLNPWVSDHPRWFKASAVVDDAFLVKFAWSQPAAQRIVHEAEVLKVLGRALPRPIVPDLIAASSDPALLVTSFVPGRPLTIEYATALEAGGRAALAEDIGLFLAELHGPALVKAIRRAGIVTRQPRPPGETAVMRRRLPAWIEPDQVGLLERWCDFADDVLARPVTEQVYLHGDLHGFNLVLAPQQPRLRRVADWETSGPGDAAFDFRYLPGQVSSTPDLFVEVVGAYERSSGRTLDVDRALAWHIRTVLGDALWRSEAGVPLPDGRTPAQWVDDLNARLAALSSTRP